MENIDREIEKKEILKRYRSLLQVCKPNTDRKDKILIRKAFNFAMEAHKDMRRKTGEPYIYHPIAVAHIAVEEIGLGTTSVISALLHDVVEDTEYTLDDINGMFGEKVTKIIDGLTKISGIFDSTSSMQAENFRKMLLTLSDDVRVILIKLADRLHNMRTLHAMTREKQLKISAETTYLYGPLAHRLGLYTIKSELEDLALKYTEPEIYANISQKLEDTQAERTQFINKFILPIKKSLNNQEIGYTIISRTKSVKSVWEKMQKKEIPFEEVYDLFAIRIIIDVPLENEKAECWRAYSVVTDYYKPNPDRLRDWISTPKANGYESLHTTVMSSEGRWVEVQIRSLRMDEIAEKGYAAHWKYKDPSTSESSLDEWLKKIRELLKSPEANAMDFLEDFKLNLFSDEIFVFTPKGELKRLPIGSTILDFAYNIHSEIGSKSIAAKVNHQLFPLSYTLKSGDQIEIITSAKQKPKEEWLKYATTARAKSHIKDQLKEERRIVMEDGRKIMEEKLKQLKMDLNAAILNKMLNFFKYTNIYELYTDVVSGNIDIKELKNFQQTNERGKWLNYIKDKFVKSKEEKGEEEISSDISSEKTKSFTIAGNASKLNYYLSTCCRPIAGDDVCGFMNKKNIIEIHRSNCENAIQLRSKYAYRIIKTKWTDNLTLSFLTGIKITGIDNVGIVNNITNIISQDLNLNIRSMNFDTMDETFVGVIMLYVHDINRLNALISKLKGIKGIDKVFRISQ